MLDDGEIGKSKNIDVGCRDDLLRINGYCDSCSRAGGERGKALSGKCTLVMDPQVSNLARKEALNALQTHLSAIDKARTHNLAVPVA